jgi:hypothetical protein
MKSDLRGQVGRAGRVGWVGQVGEWRDLPLVSEQRGRVQPARHIERRLECSDGRYLLIRHHLHD